jgi:hypothetical protein
LHRSAAYLNRPNNAAAVRICAAAMQCPTASLDVEYMRHRIGLMKKDVKAVFSIAGGSQRATDFWFSAARAEYRGANATAHLDKVLGANGFEPLWQVERPIHWHRNHGYARLKKERVSVHVKA